MAQCNRWGPARRFPQKSLSVRLDSCGHGVALRVAIQYLNMAFGGGHIRNALGKKPDCSRPPVNPAC